MRKTDANIWYTDENDVLLQPLIRVISIIQIINKYNIKENGNKNQIAKTRT